MRGTPPTGARSARVPRVNGLRNPRLLVCVGSLILAGAAAIHGCGPSDTLPCNDCPEVSGQWMLHYETGTAPSAACEQLGKTTPPEVLELAQVGSGLTSTFDGVELRGTLYDTFDFSLNGTQQDGDGGTTSITLSGRYVPALAATDAGERLQGNFVGRYGEGAACVLSRGYTAERL